MGYVDVLIVAPDSGFLNVTTDGSMPTCGSAALGEDEQLLLMKSTVVKAIACENSKASLVSEYVYEITEGFLVIVKIKLEGAVTAADLTDSVKNKILAQIAGEIGVPVERMSILSVKDARRRLLSVSLEIAVVANSQVSAEKIEKAIQDVDIEGVIQDVGDEEPSSNLKDIVVSDVVSVVQKPPEKSTTPPPVSQDNSSAPIIVASVVGAILFAVILGALIYYFLSRRAVQKRLAEKLAAAESLEERLTDDAQSLEPPTPPAAQNAQEQQEERAGDTDFNRDIQLLETTGPEVSRLLQGLRRSRDGPKFIDSQSDAVMPGQFQPAVDQDEVESRQDISICKLFLFAA